MLNLHVVVLSKTISAFTIAAMLFFKLSCKLDMCYAGGQTLEKGQIAENRLVEILK